MNKERRPLLDVIYSWWNCRAILFPPLISHFYSDWTEWSTALEGRARTHARSASRGNRCCGRRLLVGLWCIAAFGKLEQGIWTRLIAGGRRESQFTQYSTAQRLKDDP